MELPNLYYSLEMRITYFESDIAVLLLNEEPADLGVLHQHDQPHLFPLIFFVFVD